MNMRTTRGLTVIGSALLLAAAAQGRAQSADKFYLDLNLGAAVPQNTEIRSSPLGNNGNVQYDAGVRGVVGLGYHFTSSFTGELETGVIWNNVHSIRGNVLSSVNASADLYQIPLLADFIYTPFRGDFTPYAGVGVGGAMSYFDSSDVPLFGARFTDEDFSFAYQAEVGFKYSISPDIDLGLEYKFLGTTDHSWSDRGITFKTDGTMTHAILATLTWKF
jgi:opacity protein-like surface antigen